MRTLSRVLFFNPGREVEYRVSVDLFSHLLALQRPFFLKRKVGELVSMATNDTMSIRLLIGFAGLQVCNVVVRGPAAPRPDVPHRRLADARCLLPIAIGSAYMAVVRRFYSLIRVSFEGARAAVGPRARVVRRHRHGARARGRGGDPAPLRHPQPDLPRPQLRLSSMRAFSMPVLGLSGQVAAAIVLWVGGARVIAGELPVGALVPSPVLGSLVALLMAVAWVLASVSRGFVAIKRGRRGRHHARRSTCPDGHLAARGRRRRSSCAA